MEFNDKARLQILADGQPGGFTLAGMVLYGYKKMHHAEYCEFANYFEICAITVMDIINGKNNKCLTELSNT
jgi:hypothetical protein